MCVYGSHSSFIIQYFLCPRRVFAGEKKRLLNDPKKLVEIRYWRSCRSNKERGEEKWLRIWLKNRSLGDFFPRLSIPKVGLQISTWHHESCARILSFSRVCMNSVTKPKRFIADKGGGKETGYIQLLQKPRIFIGLRITGRAPQATTTVFHALFTCNKLVLH